MAFLSDPEEYTGAFESKRLRADKLARQRAIAQQRRLDLQERKVASSESLNKARTEKMLDENEQWDIMKSAIGATMGLSPDDAMNTLKTSTTAVKGLMDKKVPFLPSTVKAEEMARIREKFRSPKEDPTARAIAIIKSRKGEREYLGLDPDTKKPVYGEPLKKERVLREVLWKLKVNPDDPGIVAALNELSEKPGLGETPPQPKKTSWGDDIRGWKNKIFPSKPSVKSYTPGMGEDNSPALEEDFTPQPPAEDDIFNEFPDAFQLRDGSYGVFDSDGKLKRIRPQ